MSDFFIELTGGDERVLRRWECLFARAGWRVRIAGREAGHGTGASAGHGAGAMGGRRLLLAGITPAGAADPAAWLAGLRLAPGGLLVAFDGHGTGPGRLDNRRVAAILTAGADDFVPADIDDGVLVARIRALLRRALLSADPFRESLASADGRIRVDRARRSVTIRNGGGDRELGAVTPKEFEILALLLSREGSVVRRETLLECVWGEKAGAVNPETVDKHVEAVRRKLGRYGGRIRTVYGSGYVLAAEEAGKSP